MAGRGGACFIALLLAAAPGHTDELPLSDPTALRSRGVAALAEVVRHITASDPDLALRARRLARRIALDHYRRETPAGMRLVTGRLVVDAEGVRSRGGFYLAEHEVTVGEYREYAKARRLPVERWEGDDAHLPLHLVSLEEARAYAAAHDARIPTHDELVRACTADQRFRFPWGARFDPRCANSAEAGRGAREPVGSRPDGCSREGVADLFGNVAEWTVTGDREGHRRRYRVVGGSFRHPVRGARFITYRLRATALQHDVGFRIARSLPSLRVGS